VAWEEEAAGDDSDPAAEPDSGLPAWFIVAFVVGSVAVIAVMARGKGKGGQQAQLQPGDAAATTANPTAAAAADSYDPPTMQTSSREHLTHTRSGKEPPPVFISFRVGEALAEARAVHAALAAVGVRAYLCEDQVRVGGSWVTEISDMMQGCSVMVVLATGSYGAPGTSKILGTWEELEFGLNQGKHLCVVRMCQDFTEARTTMALGGRQAIGWADEAQSMPKVVGEVQQMLSTPPPGRSAGPPGGGAPATGVHGVS